MADPKKLPERIVFDADTVTLTVDGEPFPWAIGDATVTLLDVGNGVLLPAVEFKLLAGTLEVISSRSGG